jgi:hypothetical protein
MIGGTFPATCPMKKGNLMEWNKEEICGKLADE